MCSVEDELQGLESIYCQPGEFSISEYCNGKELTIRLFHHQDNSVKVKVTLRVPDNYPDCIPNIGLESDGLTRQQLNIIQRAANDLANQSKGDIMLFTLTNFIQEKLDSTEYDAETDEVACDNCTALLVIDHMRAKSKYIKTIQKWTEELNLKGRLLFYKKLILIILQGCNKNVKDYILRKKTVNIDVDSHGRSCKERMMTVLCESSTPINSNFEDFSMLECDNKEDFEKIFTDSDLNSLYCTYIKGVYL